MISNVSLLIKVVYYIEDSEEKIKSNSITGNYSMKLKSKKDYDEWFLPISLFLQREQFI